MRSSAQSQERTGKLRRISSGFAVREHGETWVSRRIQAVSCRRAVSWRAGSALTRSIAACIAGSLILGRAAALADARALVPDGAVGTVI